MNYAIYCEWMVVMIAKWPCVRHDTEIGRRMGKNIHQGFNCHSLSISADTEIGEKRRLTLIYGVLKKIIRIEIK